MANNTSKPNDFCLNLIRKHDHDRYLTMLYAPEQSRSALASLYAFNIEIARIRESVSDPMLGEIKIQWWRDAIAEIYLGKDNGHDVLRALTKAIKEHHLPIEAFNQILDHRVTDLYDEPPKTFEELEQYLWGTVGIILKLACQILGTEVEDKTINQLALGWGYTGLIRAIPYHLSLRKNYIPLELLEQKKLEGHMGPGPDHRQEVQIIVRVFCYKAQNALDHIRHTRKNISGSARPAFLLAPLARSYLKTIRKADHNPFELHEKQDEMFRQFRLITSALFNRL